MCCLIRRPQYFASVIRFGSRGPGRKEWPRKKSEKWDNLSHLFTEPISSGGRELYEHSERGTAREWQFELLAFGLMLTAQIKRLIWIQKVIYWIRSIITVKPQANPDCYLFFGSLPGAIQQILQSDWFLERAEFSHTDRNSGRNPSSWSISVNKLAVIVNLAPFLHVHRRLINGSLSLFTFSRILLAY